MSTATVLQCMLLYDVLFCFSMVELRVAGNSFRRPAAIAQLSGASFPTSPSERAVRSSDAKLDVLYTTSI